jgi:SAM-dependent methyltransferase
MSFYSKFAPYYDQIFPFRETTYAFLKSYLPHRSSAILDLGCGTGQYAGRFAAEGYPAYGVDRDTQMISSAVLHYPQADFRVQDISEIDQFEKQFDLVYCIGNTAAHLTQEQFQKMLLKLNARMTPGAIWILQVVNWDFILQQKSFRFPQIRLSDNSITFLRGYQDISSDKLTFQTTLNSADTVLFSETATLHPMALDELLNAHRNIRFNLLGHFADYNRAPYDRNIFSGNIQVWRKP